MGLITKEVPLKINNKYIHKYESMGYQIPKHIGEDGKEHYIKNSIITVKVADLSCGSATVRVDVQCDHCYKILNISAGNYLKYVHKDGTYYCSKCAQELIRIPSQRQKKIQQGFSFYDWCYKNLSKNEADSIISRWDYELNKCSPKDVLYNSIGIEHKGYWFKCDLHPEHHSELKKIKYFVTGHDSLSCLQCKSLGQFILDKYGKDGINVYWSNKNNLSPFEISIYYKDKVWLKCPDCHDERKLNPWYFTKYGFTCLKCGDGFPYPEKFVYGLLQQLNINFEYHKKFDWCKYKLNGKQTFGIYDFYLPKYNLIIETDGALGHGRKNKITGQTAKASKLIDDIKDQIANNHNIEVIRIDCAYEDLDRLEYVKNNILKSKLSNIFDLSKINWKEIDKQSQGSLVKEACNLWKLHKYSTTEIGEKIRLGKNTVENYLKIGTKIGLCHYNPLDVKRSYFKKVYCLELDKVFESVAEAGRQLNMNRTDIRDCCMGKYYYSGKLPDGTKLHWMYYDKYLANGKKFELTNYVNKHFKKVYCVELNMVYDGIVEANRQTKINRQSIGNCCNHKSQTAGGYHWIFYNEYLKCDKKVMLNELDNKPRCKKVYCVELHKIYYSILDACNQTKINKSGIGECCRNYHNRTTAGGYHWLFYEDYLKQQKAS